jgi:hypothetical protein
MKTGWPVALSNWFSLASMTDDQNLAGIWPHLAEHRGRQGDGSLLGGGGDIIAPALAQRQDLLLGAQKRIDDLGIKMGPAIAPDDGHGLLVRHRIFVDAAAGEGVVHIRHRDDPAAQRDLLSRQAQGITRAVILLMVGGGDFPGELEEARVGKALQRRIERLSADQRMRLHDGKFIVGELAGFEQHGVGDADFAQIVQRAGLIEQADIFVIDPVMGLVFLGEMAGDGAGVALDALDVSAGFIIAALGQLGQREQRHVARLQGENPLGGLQTDEQLVGIQGLVEEIVGAGAQAFHALLGALAAGQHDHVDIAGNIFPPRRAAQLDAVHFRHVPIGDDQPDLALVQDLHGLAPIVGGDHGVAHVGHRVGHDAQGEIIIIHNKNLHVHLNSEQGLP